MFKPALTYTLLFSWMQDESFPAASLKFQHNFFVPLSAHFFTAEDRGARGLSAASLGISAHPITQLQLFGKGTERLERKKMSKRK